MDHSHLSDFHPYDTGLVPPIQDLFEEYHALAQAPTKSCTRTQFLALLTGVAALRKTPGLPGPNESGKNYFTSLPQCATPEDAAACRAHLEQVFGITDTESLIAFFNQEQRCQNNYLDFESFWENRPAFDLNALEGEGLTFFQSVRDFAAQFYHIVGRHGFLAWDISNCVEHLRNAYACGILNREEFDELAEYWIDQAQTFHNWVDYAASFVCGALYWDFRGGAQPSELQQSQALWLHLVRMLLNEKNAWGSALWYTPPCEKQFLIPAVDIRPLLQDWDDPDCCIASDRILVDGCSVGWCYREEPQPDCPDSGWRFFAGDESSDDTSDTTHAGIYPLNVLCNYDPAIIPLLRAPIGTAFMRDSAGHFHQESFTPPEE